MTGMWHKPLGSDMTPLPVEVRPAQTVDLAPIQDLQRRADHAFMRSGYEDLVRMVAHDYCLVAGMVTDPHQHLWGYVCASVRQPGLAQLRGLGLIDGWRIDVGVDSLLTSLETALAQNDVRHLMHVGVEEWVVAPLQRRGFATPDHILNFERGAPTRPLVPEHKAVGASLRPLAPHEIDDLAALDQRAFPWPWQLSSGELIQLLLTTSRLAILEFQSLLIGYVCTDVVGEHAQIIRLAVDPVYQGMGFGRYLLADALDFAAATGVRRISLNTQTQNRSSQRLYQGFGFRTVGRRVPILLKPLDPHRNGQP